MNFTSPAPPKTSAKKWFVTGLIGLAVTGLVAAFFIKSDGKPKREASTSSIVNITLPPPPPPLPPPPPPPPPTEVVPREEEMIEQEPVAADEPKPEEAPAPDEPPADLTTGLTGDGPNNFGLNAGKSGNGNNGQIGGKGSGRGGSKWGWYASGVQTSIVDALRQNPSTRTGSYTLQIRIWPDQTGRITRAQLVGTSGNSAVDSAIQSQVLTGLQLKEPPPEGMPSPIVLRINARKPVP